MHGRSSPWNQCVIMNVINLTAYHVGLDNRDYKLGGHTTCKSHKTSCSASSCAYWQGACAHVVPRRAGGIEPETS